MINPEQAKTLLEEHQVEDWMARRQAAVAKLSSPLAGLAWQLLGCDKNGKKLKSLDWHARDRVKVETAQELENLSVSDRLAIFEALFPKIAPQIEAAWQLQKQFPYQLGGYRRAFRAPQSPELTLSRRSRWLYIIFSVTTGYEEDVAWLAKWAAYLGGYGQSDALGVLFAATIDTNTEVGEQVFDILVATAKGEQEVGAMGHHVTQGLLSASRPAGWSVIEQLLIAAQRQEGLRQVILETVDEAHPEAFRRMVRLIREHNLTRFSSVVRAIDVWLALQWEAANARVVQKTLEQLDDFLHNPEQRLAALAGDNSQQAYLALCVSGFEDVQIAIGQAKPLLDHPKLEHRFVATYFLAQLNLAEARDALQSKLDDQDLRVATVAFQAVSPAYRQDTTPSTLFEQIEAILPRFPAKKQRLEPLVWPWLELTADQQMLANALPGVLEERPYTRLFPYLSLMDTWARSNIIRTFIEKDKKPWTAETREIILKLMGDRSQHVRQTAIETSLKMQLEPDETEQLEGYLTRKAGDLRRGILGVLLQQNDKAVLNSTERLLAAKHQMQRQAGLELLRQLKEKHRQTQQVHKLARNYAAQKQQLTESEQTLLAAIEDRQPEPATLADGLGLFNPAQRTPIVAPKAQTGLFNKQLFSRSSAAVACLHSLDDLIHTHRETSITLPGWQGETHEELLGNLHWAFPAANPAKSITEDIAQLPLAEVWQNWWAERSSKLRDQDGLEIFRALLNFEARDDRVPFYLLDSTSDDWFKKAEKTLYGAVDLKELRYGPIINTILWWLVRISPHPQAVDFLLNAVEHNFHLIHRKKWFTQVEDRRSLGLLGWLNLTRQHRQLCPLEWQAAHDVRFWRLLRWLDDLNWARRQDRADIDEIMRAYHADGATDADIFYHLLGAHETDKQHRWAGNSFNSLRDLSSRKPQLRHIKFATDAKLQACIAQCRQRIVEVELERGDLPTAASKPALALRYSGGLDTLLQLLRAFGKETFERGWIYGSELNKRAIFSHLIRSTFPAETDTSADFVEQFKGYNITPKRLIETAIYAPQWASHIEATLDWPEFAEAVWWFHAHTKDHQWRIDQDIREGWQAQTNERTPLSGQDLLDGAVDVAWFQRVYTALGADRWAKLDQAAKYASGGGGHKRAQLFAQAMLGQIEETSLVQRISQKRHQDTVRALGLLPLPLNGQRDDVILRRYQIIQEFVQGSRKFGSQRQASEKLAAKIGLENLARTAGFPDPLRLEWAMETRAVADLAAGPVSVIQDDVTVTLAIDEWGDPNLTIIKKGRSLKAVPAKLKKQPDIATLLNRKREIKKQASRMRQSLEQAMYRGDVFVGTELKQLLAHPVLKPMLTQLVFIGDSVMGYPSDDGQQLQGIKGQHYSLDPNVTLRLAHPHDLLLSNEWHIWQTECFNHEYIQPFKQVFRELYVPTATETDQATFSQRYAGHQVNPRQALALLGQRGWVNHPEEGVRRTFHNEGIAAWLSFQNGYFTPAEVDGLTLAEVHFSRRGDWKALLIDQIPPRLFSEVMRDLDLVVSVAHVGGVDPEASASTIEMRTALISETCHMLGLEQVRLKNKHALIDGSLNNYSVHLGSGVVHQQPGGYLCLVPVHSQRRGRIFLPFADDDPKTAEIISKVLLLAQDNKIKDPSILEQILPRV